MRYRNEWKGHLKVVSHPAPSVVTWDGVRIGTVRQRYSPGAKSPKGMLTENVYDAVPVNGTPVVGLASLDLALAHLIEQRTVQKAA